MLKYSLRCSGIPTIHREMEKYNRKKPKFEDKRGSIIVIFYKSGNIGKTELELEEVNNRLGFCRTSEKTKGSKQLFYNE